MPQLRTYIVEDSPVIRHNLIAALEELVPVLVIGAAEDEYEAVEWIKSSGVPVDLLIVDVFLKRGSGLGVLSAASQFGVPAKMVVLSNYATPEMRRKCTELGADRVFDKSNELEELVQYCMSLRNTEPLS